MKTQASQLPKRYRRGLGIGHQRSLGYLEPQRVCVNTGLTQRLSDYVQEVAVNQLLSSNIDRQ